MTVKSLKLDGRPKSTPAPEQATEAQSPEKDPVGETSEGPGIDELLARIDPAVWPLNTLEFKFGKRKDDWGPAEVSQLADLATAD